MTEGIDLRLENLVSFAQAENLLKKIDHTDLYLNENHCEITDYKSKLTKLNNCELNETNLLNVISNRLLLLDDLIKIEISEILDERIIAKKNTKSISSIAPKSRDQNKKDINNKIKLKYQKDLLKNKAFLKKSNVSNDSKNIELMKDIKKQIIDSNEQKHSDDLNNNLVKGCHGSLIPYVKYPYIPVIQTQNKTNDNEITKDDIIQHKSNDKDDCVKYTPIIIDNNSKLENIMFHVPVTTPVKKFNEEQYLQVDNKLQLENTTLKWIENEVISRIINNVSSSFLSNFHNNDDISPKQETGDDYICSRDLLISTPMPQQNNELLDLLKTEVFHDIIRSILPRQSTKVISEHFAKPVQSVINETDSESDKKDDYESDIYTPINSPINQLEEKTHEASDIRHQLQTPIITPVSSSESLQLPATNKAPLNTQSSLNKENFEGNDINVFDFKAYRANDEHDKLDLEDSEPFVEIHDVVSPDITPRSASVATLASLIASNHVATIQNDSIQKIPENVSLDKSEQSSLKNADVSFGPNENLNKNDLHSEEGGQEHIHMSNNKKNQLNDDSHYSSEKSASTYYCDDQLSDGQWVISLLSEGEIPKAQFDEGINERIKQFLIDQSIAENNLDINNYNQDSQQIDDEICFSEGEICN